MTRPSPLRCRAAATHARWLAAAGPWQRWCLCIPLLGPGLDELQGLDSLAGATSRAPARGALLQDVRRVLDGAAAGMPRAPALCVLDTPPVAGVRVAAALAREGRAAPVLVLGRWPCGEAVLPARELVGALLAATARLGAPTLAQHAVLVLDGERRRPLAGRPRGDRRADNRYDLAPEELPDAASLLHHGIQRVVVWSPDGQPPRDVAPAYAAYLAAAIPVIHRVMPGRATASG